MGIEASPMVARTRSTGALEDIFSTSGAGEAWWACAGVANGCGVVGYASTTVPARLGRAMVLVGAFFTW